MKRDFDSLKDKLWAHFERASDDAANWRASEMLRTTSTVAVGTIGQALVDVYREERERSKDDNAHEMGKGLKG